MEAPPKLQEARYSIQDILRKDANAVNLRPQTSNDPGTMTLTLPQAVPLTKDVHLKTDRNNIHIDDCKSSKCDATRTHHVGGTKPSFLNPPNTSRQEKRHKRKQPEKPYVPIWLLNNWAGPTASALRKETASEPSSVRETILSLYNYGDGEGSSEFKDGRVTSVANAGSETVHDQVSRQVRKAPTEKFEDGNAAPNRHLSGPNSNNGSNSKSLTQYFNQGDSLSQTASDSSKKIQVTLKPYHFSGPYSNFKVFNLFDTNGPKDNTQPYREERPVDVETHYDPKHPNRSKSFDCSACQALREKVVCPLENVPYIKNCSCFIPFITSDEHKTQNEIQQFPSEASFQHKNSLDTEQDVLNDSQEKDARKSPKWACLQVQLDDSSRSFLEPNALKIFKSHSLVQEGTPFNLESVLNITNERQISPLQQDESTLIESFYEKEVNVSDSSNHEFILSEHQAPSPQRYRVNESLTSNVVQTKEGVTVTLLNSALWKAFSTVGTEMIINRSGRRMFPYIALSVSGLSPGSMYRVSLQILPASSRRFKYITNRWLPVGIADTEAMQEPYIHTDSLSRGDQLNKTKLIFSKVKLTNNKESAECNILLHSMHKYRIVTTFTEVKSANLAANQLAECRGTSLSFHFPETDFIAVTAYQNGAVTQMKIHNNPFAKAFRDTNFASFRRGVSSRRKRPSLPNNSDKPAKHPNLCQNPARQSSSVTTCRPETSEMYQLRMSFAQQTTPGQDAEYAARFPGAEAAMLVCDEPRGPPFTHSGLTLSPSYLLSPDKLQFAPPVSPWMSLYSNIVRSHLLQFQYIHASAATAAQPDSTTTTLISTTATTTTATTTLAPGGGDATESSVPTSLSRVDAGDSSYLQMVPFHALHPETGERVGYHRALRLPQPMPSVPDLRGWDMSQIIVGTPKSADNAEGHI